MYLLITLYNDKFIGSSCDSMVFNIYIHTFLNSDKVDASRWLTFQTESSNQEPVQYGTNHVVYLLMELYRL